MISERMAFPMVVTMVLLAALVVAPAAARTITTNGAGIFIGEENLDFAGDFAGTTQLVHYTGIVGQSSIDKSLTLSSGILSELFKGIPTGNYYDPANTLHYINVQNPEATLDVMLSSSPRDSVNGKSINRGTSLDFKFYSNVNTGAMANVELTLPSGGVVTVYNNTALWFNANGQTQYIPGIIFGQDAEVGTYTAAAKWASSSDFFGKGFDSRFVTFEVRPPRNVAITSNKDCLVRGQSFTVTVTGESNTAYRLYVREIADLAPAEYPEIIPGQLGVTPITPTDATIKTTAGGTRTVQFNTDQSTADYVFTICVEDPVNPGIHDEVRVRVERGSVTITASGIGVYYTGEEITLSGTSTAGNMVYLFMTGPNLGTDGVKLDDLYVKAESTKPETFRVVDVETDDTWSYKWDTSVLNKTIDAGSYVIYAVSSASNKSDLLSTEYSMILVQLRTGFVSATMDSATVAKGDKLTISGVATGSPDCVWIWIFGPDFYGGTSGALKATPTLVESDGSFEFKFKNTKDWTTGQYFVIVQHPMGAKAGAGSITWNPDGLISGDGINKVDLTRLQAPAAATALINALDSPNIPDTYVKLTFVVDEPLLTIDPIGTKEAGSKFTISGTTNLAVGNTLIVEVAPATLQSGEATGISSYAGIVAIQRGRTTNTWSFMVDGTGFRPDQYVVKVEAIEASMTATALFNMIEGDVIPPSDPSSSGSITLFPGWNFVSVPRPLAAGNDTAMIFAGVETENRSVLWYNTAVGEWEPFTATDQIKPLDGIWIYSTGPATVPLTFSTDPLLPPAERTLSAGWNTVGATGTAPATARDTFYSVNAGWTTLIGFDAANQIPETGIINGGSGAYSDTRSIYSGKGYWLYMTNPGTLCAIGA
jgi:hypothetical protein